MTNIISKSCSLSSHLPTKIYDMHIKRVATLSRKKIRPVLLKNIQNLIHSNNELSQNIDHHRTLQTTKNPILLCQGSLTKFKSFTILINFFAFLTDFLANSLISPLFQLIFLLNTHLFKSFAFSGCLPPLIFVCFHQFFKLFSIDLRFFP